MNALATALMAWIAAHSSYDTATMPLPDIALLTPEALTAEFYRDAPQDIPASRVDARVIALYSHEDGPHGTIFLLTPEPAWPGDDPLQDPIFQEQLLHELVHHAQRLSGVMDSWQCRNQGEREAYRLGGLFLARNHATDPLPNRAFWGEIYSRC
ncbi:hypothetical protein [Tropicibacter sp. S64]|uniref:hypothetical protein n=1 Tax=Tropicibacter sp. S64 TaxID=3415122 RepID=UPI003C7BAF93